MTLKFNDERFAELVLDDFVLMLSPNAMIPIDKAAGHIPGALNRFWKENITENGLFKDKQALRQEFEAILRDTPPEESVFYCGSGVTACHNLLAAAHAGLKLPKLYAGSWSEWSNNPDKPVATGA